MPWCRRSHVLRHFTQALSTNLGTMMSQITHFTLLCSQHVKKKDTKKARYPDAVDERYSLILWWKNPTQLATKSSVPWCHEWHICSTMMRSMTHDDALLVTQFWLQQSGYCGRSLSGHLHGHDLICSISVNAARSSSQSAGCSQTSTTQSLQCPQM